jgi:putative membrane protein
MILFAHWQPEPEQIAPLAALGSLYWLRASLLAARGRAVPRAKQVRFYCGVAVALIAVISPIDWYGENRLLWVHMIQHLLLGDIAPLLVVSGLSGALLRPLLAIRWLRPLRALAHPLVALPLWTFDLYVWHLPFMYQAALRHNGIHALEHTCFFFFGGLMWAALIEPLPGPVWFTGGWKAAYTLVVRAAGMVLAQILIWSTHPFYAYYVHLEHSRAAALSDQRTAGAVMLVEGMIVTMLAFAWLFLRFVAETEARQRLIEGGLEPQAAARAARYGRSARVRAVMRGVLAALPQGGESPWRS